MREIKFRAWDKVEKHMRWLTDIIKLGKSETDRHVLMQFTGLKDSNGKEIYAGDIVAASIYGDEEPQELEVEFRNSAFVIDYEDSESDVVNIGEFVGTLEIIGNIYEKGKF